MKHSDPARALLDAVTVFYDGPGRVEGSDVANMLDMVRADLGRVSPFERLPRPHRVAASALLVPALDAMRNALLAAAIMQAMPLFRWRQNPNYTVANMGAGFMAGYGYVEFAGPKDALFRAPRVRVGLLLLGPGLHYPMHAHPAEEIYHPLTDGGLWRRGEESWRAVPADHPIHHPPMMPHETRAMERTLLALYCWRGDTTTEARLTPVTAVAGGGGAD